MRYRNLLHLILLLAVTSPLYGQSTSGGWAFLPNGPDAVESLQFRHDDINFIDENIGWVVNRSGQIWKTTDGGQAWVKQLDMGFNRRFRSVGFANPDLGWVGTILTPDAVLFETRDGGETWTDITTRITGVGPAGVCGLYVVNESVAYGVGAFFGEPTLIKTIDGGQTWTGTDMRNDIATLVDVYFQDENIGFVIGSSSADLKEDAIILRTTDGGDTWTEVHRTTRNEGVDGQWGWKIAFPSEDVGYVAVEYGSNATRTPAKIEKTVDGGLTWTEIYVPGSTDHAGLQAVGFVTEDVGWATGRGTTSVTLDGGATWQQVPDYSSHTQTGELDGAVNRIFVVNDTLAYAAGRFVHKFTGRIVSTAVEDAPEVPKSFSISQNFPNPFRPSTTIAYTLFRDVSVRIIVYDALGRRVRTLVDQRETPGEHTVTWNGRDDDGTRLASGNYFYLMDIGEGLEMKKMVMLN